MYKEQTDTSLGYVQIDKKVISSIASISTLETEGVSRLASRFVFGIPEVISTIKVNIYKNGEIGLNVPIVVKYGYNIPDVAYKVQENIQLALEKMTNMSVKYINIIVKSVERSKT
ncbi:MAG: Asp23/Gls24 family envelope stress response protein [Candidatus Omnitrophica bacterium]|nr:Asp23/Gls24 family envelope stress response protein [Candidatus Omnitrophota bacterium]